MAEIKGNIWKYRNPGYIVIPTNGFVKANGEAVMGRGLAQQATKIFPGIRSALGGLLMEWGNHCFFLKSLYIITFPTKHNWWETADIELIKQSLIELQNIVNDNKLNDIYMPYVGCGNGQLEWQNIKPLLLSFNYTIVDLKIK